MRSHTLIAVVTMLGVLCPLAGCGGQSSSDAPGTVTVTSTMSPQRSSTPAPPVSAPARGDAYAGLAAGFARVAAGAGAQVGIAIAPVGGKPVAALTLGDHVGRVAWSTIKVPLAVAAERANGRSAAQTAAIVESDNAAAESLWASLGSPAAAAAAVTAVLREGGDTTTVVPDTIRRAGYTIFGQSVWTLPAAATFTAHLPCLRGSAHVVALMGRVAGNQQWGVEIMKTPRSMAVKGGWGPGETSGYLVRQIGIFTHAGGKQTAVAMSALAGSMSGGIAALDAVAAWLNTNIARLPQGSCPG